MGENSNAYPVQTLYYSCLNYLQNNYKLIDFTRLNDEIASDMIKIIKNSNHLKKFRMFPYRFIFNRASLESYIYRYCKLNGKINKEIISYNTRDNVRALLARGKYFEYTSGILTISEGLLYDTDNDKCYHVTLKLDEYLKTIHEEEAKKMYPEYVHLVTKYDDDLLDIFSEKFFNQYPGMAKWAESTNRISKKLLIPENIISTPVLN
jgi:hypothetical protein